MLKLITDESLQYNLDEMVRLGAKKMLMQALAAEVSEVIDKYKSEVDENGNRLVVRNGKGKSRSVTLGSGAIEIEAPRVNDRREGHKFTSWILPPYLRKSPKVESLIPILYLRGTSTGKMADTLGDFFGEGSMGLSPATISKLIKTWGFGLPSESLKNLLKQKNRDAGFIRSPMFLINFPSVSNVQPKAFFTK